MIEGIKLFKVLPAVKEIYPAFKSGVMVVHGLNAATADRQCMETLKSKEIEQIKAMHEGYDRKIAVSSEPVCHYSAYYKTFKKTYHVLLQLESVLLKNKGIPNIGVPVEAMFLAEVKNLLLTAGHDLEKLNGNLTINIAAGEEEYQDISGREQQLTKNDIYFSDESGILSSILYGPDYRTQITNATKSALYFVYGVDGISEAQIRKHLEDIHLYLSKVIQTVKVESIEVY
jgi:DNA/RNA-binding domain of Phe-tRNA-synthetase-like protein